MKRRRFDSSDDDDSDVDENEIGNYADNHKTVNNGKSRNLVSAENRHADMMPFAVSSESLSDMEEDDIDEKYGPDDKNDSNHRDFDNTNSHKHVGVDHDKKDGIQKTDLSKVELLENCIHDRNTKVNLSSTETIKHNHNLERVMHNKSSSQVQEDRDVPTEFNGLLSDALLKIYRRSLFYWSDDVSRLSEQIDDITLLEMYSPQRSIDKTKTDNTTHNVLTSEYTNFSSKSYQNEYSITPGWRWDGVVRGRSEHDGKQERR